MNCSKEIITKAKQVKGAKELLAFAKETGMELTEVQPQIYFEQLIIFLMLQSLNRQNGGYYAKI